LYNSLENYVKNGFDGMLVFGDTHGDYTSFEKAYNFAKSENFFFMSMGDLVDRGRQPFEVVKAMYEAMYEGRAGLVIGNHDDKFRRYADGAKVSFSTDAKRTLDDVGADRMEDFLKMYVSMIDDKMFSGFFHKFDEFTLVHAGCHKRMWESGFVMSKTEKARFLVGETNGQKYDDGYPVRLYNWIEDVPLGKTVMVGHDKMPIHNVDITEPMTVSNKNGGKVIFLDTGCGKGGFLSGAVMLSGKKGFVVDRFVEFK
jgi:protein phosphatase